MDQNNEDSTEKLYNLVEKIGASSEPGAKNKQWYRHRDPTTRKALRISRHLRALEQDILDLDGKNTVSLAVDPFTDTIIVSIHNEDFSCSRKAYLNPKEFYLLRKNKKVAAVFRKCPSWNDVA